MNGSQDIIIGIDLGTTNSLVAYADAKGPVVLGDEFDDSGLVPSVIAFDPASQTTVIGAAAKAHAVEKPLATVFSIKRLMGKGFAEVREEIKHLPYKVVRRPTREDDRDLPAIDIDGRLYTAPELSAMILKTLRDRAEAHFGRTITRAVISVPAYFDDAQRQATRDAGRIAGLDVLRIVNEPTAAALAYRLDRSEQATLAVYDFGGGTFDVTILKISEGVFEVLSTHGDTVLGGDDLDREIIKLVTCEVKQNLGVDISAPAARQALRLFAEQVKVRLSTDEEAVLSIDLGQGRTYERKITRAEFESLIAPWVDKTLHCCKQAVADAKIDVREIDQVVMVGGSTRIPLVRRRVGEYFHRQPYTALNPDQVVALGVAVQASILAGKTQDLLLLDVTPLSLGIETMGEAMGKLILRNARIPTQATEMFTTFVDGQTSIKINVLQGERELAKDCRSLGVFELEGIPPMPAGLPKCEVTFLIDQNGILNVSAVEQRSGQAAGIQIVPAHGLTPDEVDQMVQDSYQYARQDLTAHRLIDLRNQVIFDTDKAEQMLAKVGDRLPAEERTKIETEMEALRKLAQSSEDANRIHEALNNFDKMTVPLAELAITVSLRTTTAN